MIIHPSFILSQGKHKGYSLSEVYQYDPTYINWMVEFIQGFEINIDEFYNLPKPIVSVPPVNKTNIFSIESFCACSWLQLKTRIKNKSIVPLVGRQILYDASYGEFHNFVLPSKNLNCEICSEVSTILNMTDSKKNMQDYEDKVKNVSHFMFLFKSVITLLPCIYIIKNFIF